MSSSNNFIPVIPGQSAYNPRLTDEIWNQFKPLLTDLRKEGFTVKETFEIIRDEHSFPGTWNQLYKKLRRWGLAGKLQTSDPGLRSPSLLVNDRLSADLPKGQKPSDISATSTDRHQTRAGGPLLQDLWHNEGCEAAQLDIESENLLPAPAGDVTETALVSPTVEYNDLLKLSPSIFDDWPGDLLKAFESPKPAQPPISRRSSLASSSNGINTSLTLPKNQDYNITRTGSPDVSKRVGMAVEPKSQNEIDDPHNQANIQHAEHSKRTRSMATSSTSSIIRMSNGSTQSFLRLAKRLRTNPPLVSRDSSPSTSLLSFTSSHRSWRFSMVTHGEQQTEDMNVEDMLRRSLDLSISNLDEDNIQNQPSWLNLPGSNRISDVYLELLMQDEKDYTKLPSDEVVDLRGLCKKYNYDLETPCWEILFGLMETHRAKTELLDFQVILSDSEQQRLIGPYDKPLSMLEKHESRGFNPVILIRDPDTVPLIVDVNQQDWVELTRKSPLVHRIQSLRICPEDEVGDVLKLLTGSAKVLKQLDLRLKLSVNSRVLSRTFFSWSKPVAELRDIQGFGLVPRLVVRRMKDSELVPAFSPSTDSKFDHSNIEATKIEANESLVPPEIQLFKSFSVSVDIPCRKILRAALRKYGFQADWRQYGLFIVYGDTGRLIGLEEKPLLVFKEIEEEGKKPMFMLRKWESSNGEASSPIVAEGGEAVTTWALE